MGKGNFVCSLMSLTHHIVSNNFVCLQPVQIREMERKQKLEQRQQDKLFFQEMEQNILMSLRRGQRIPLSVAPEPAIQKPAATAIIPTTGTSAPRARTLSGMDEVLMQQFSMDAPIKQPQVNQYSNLRPRDAHGRPPLNPLPTTRVTTMDSSALEVDSAMPFQDSLEFSPEQMDRRHPLTRDDSGELELRGVALLDGPLEEDDAMCDAIECGSKIQQQQQRPHVRRNTGGTIYMKSTMMNPDIKATIKVSRTVNTLHEYLGFPVLNFRWITYSG